MKVKKRTKSSRMHGRKMGTHSGGCRKNRKGSGHRGGIGMAGSGKRGDAKKTLVLKKYGGNYFGKKGITSIGTNLSGYKILGQGEVKNKLIIKAFEASKSAIEKVKAKGGEIKVKEKKKIKTPLVESPKVIEKRKKAEKKKK